VDERLDAWLGAENEDLDALWRRLLRRPLEESERVATEARLAQGMSRAALAQELVTSDEFARIRLLDDAVAWAAAQRRGGERPRGIEAPPGTDERPIEIPWCLARYAGEGAVLDAGYAFAEPAYLAGLLGLGARELPGVDLVAADVPGLRPVEADLRRLPFDDGAFELAIAISTLEHVGSDNTQYGLAAEADADGIDSALAQLRRVAARVLVTVPAGEHELRPEQAVLTPSDWVERFERAGFVIWEDELYELGDAGWRSTSQLTPGVRYGDRGPGASAVLCAELRPRTVGTRLRLAARDRRYRGDVRRSTG
jgi:hypothetical protein